jgi:hypothetical protein
MPSILFWWLRSIQVAFYAATAAVCGYAWAGSSGFAPTGSQVADGFLEDVRGLFRNKTVLSAVLALSLVVASALGALTLGQPLTYFQPADFRCACSRVCMHRAWPPKPAVLMYVGRPSHISIQDTVLGEKL